MNDVDCKLEYYIALHFSYTQQSTKEFQIHLVMARTDKFSEDET